MVFLKTRSAFSTERASEDSLGGEECRKHVALKSKLDRCDAAHDLVCICVFFYSQLIFLLRKNRQDLNNFSTDKL
jgi:hypothetical protein